MRPRKYATTSEAAIRALAAEGLNFVQMAEKLNVPIGALRTTASVLGIKSGRGHGDTALPLQEWIDRLAAGDTLDELAKDHHGTSRQNIRSALARRGLPTSCRLAVKFKALQAQKESARVAQSAEHLTRNQLAAGSTPAPGTNIAEAALMPLPLTPTQSRVLEFIAQHIVEKQRPPTRQDVARNFGWASPNAAETHIQMLVARGYLAQDSASGQAWRYVRVIRWPDSVAPLIQLATSEV